MAKVSVDIPNGFLSIDTARRKVVSRVEDLSKKIWNGVTSRTPVRTGDLRASWRIALGSPDGSTTSGGSTGAPLPSPAFAFPKDFKLGDVVVISNSKSYYKYIENGSPTTKAYGPIRVTLAGLRE